MSRWSWVVVVLLSRDARLGSVLRTCVVCGACSFLDVRCIPCDTSHLTDPQVGVSSQRNLTSFFFFPFCTVVLFGDVMGSG
jgi:hypothetical protein